MDRWATVEVSTHSVTEFIADQSLRNTAWWGVALASQWSIQSDITAHGLFVVSEPQGAEHNYGVFRVTNHEVTMETPLALSRRTAFRRLRKLERLANEPVRFEEQDAE